MDTATMKNMLKVDLGITTDAYDTRFEQYLVSAEAAISREGIELDKEVIEDCDLIIRYAAWLWRKRDTGEGIPRSLRWQMNNRLFSEKV